MCGRYGLALSEEELRELFEGADVPAAYQPRYNIAPTQEALVARGTEAGPELVWARPTAEFNGISGGYEGDGFKTVIAAQASAKVSFRLVHKQDPDAIRAAFRKFVEDRIPADCSVSFERYGGSPAIQLSYDAPIVAKAASALSDEWPKKTLVLAMGGSIPIVGDFQTMLGMESLLVGFGLDDDRIHSPNEKYDLRSFHKGQRSWARILAALAS